MQCKVNDKVKYDSIKQSAMRKEEQSLVWILQNLSALKMSHLEGEGVVSYWRAEPKEMTH